MTPESGNHQTNQSEPEDVSGKRELEELGYTQELKRSLGLTRMVALVVSDITPATSLLVIAPVVIALTGTGIFWVYLISAVLGISVALCMAELGSMYPVAGGLYSIVTRVLGRRIGFLAMIDYLGQAVFLPAAIVLGFGTYASALFPGLDPNLTAFVVMIIITGLAMLAISTNAVLTGFFLALELTLLTAIAVVGFANVQRPFTTLLDPITVSPTGTVTAVSIALIFTGVATGLFSFNGYDSAINFSEESEGEAKQVGQAVLISAVIGVSFQAVPLIAIILSAPALGELINSDAPVSYAFESAVGSVGNVILTIGALIAIFAAVLAITLQFARIVYSTGRDRAWPGPVNNVLSKVSNQFNSPWVAVLVVGGLASILTLFGGLVLVVTFTAVLIIIMYLLIAISTLVSRWRRPDAVRPFRMPLWPVPPVLALLGVGVAVTQQKLTDLLIVAGIFLLGAVYYVLFLRPRRSTHWRDSEGLLEQEEANTDSNNL